VPFWAKDLNVGFANINAKAEGIENRPAFREAFHPNKLCAELHNRMPAVLKPEAWSLWLGEEPADPDELKALARQVGATAEEISPARRENRENRALGRDNSIQRRTARDGRFPPRRALPLLGGFVVCPAVSLRLVTGHMQFVGKSSPPMTFRC
jgi:putative SOS response-associated peptidase YedK